MVRIPAMTQIFLSKIIIPSDYKIFNINETWYLTLREEQRFRVSENKMLTKIFGALKDKSTEERRELHNAELRALYSSPNIIRNLISRQLRWVRHVVHMKESRNAYRVLVEKH